MSAWIVGNESINKIVNTFYWKKSVYYDWKEELKSFGIDLNKDEDKDLNEELRKFGQLLADLNQNSVNQRYNTTDEAFKFKFSDVESLSIFQYLKSLECFLYQSCEGNCEEDKLYKFLRKLVNTLKDEIINEIDEYKKAKWE